jgi:hypothetical protein
MTQLLSDISPEGDRLVVKCLICRAERSFTSNPCAPSNGRTAEDEARAWWMEHKDACHRGISEYDWDGVRVVPNCHKVTRAWWVTVACTCSCPSCDGPCEMLRKPEAAKMHILSAVLAKDVLDMQGLRGQLFDRKANVRELQLRQLVIELIQAGKLVLVDAGFNRITPEFESQEYLKTAYPDVADKVWNARGYIAVPELANAS